MFLPSSRHLDRRGTPLASRERGESPARPPPLNTKAGFINSMSYSLPKYYFQDIHPEIMDEIMRAMQAALPEPSSEEIDNWPNTHNIASNIPGWYDHAGEFLVVSKSECPSHDAVRFFLSKPRLSLQEPVLFARRRPSERAVLTTGDCDWALLCRSDSTSGAARSNRAVKECRVLQIVRPQ